MSGAVTTEDDLCFSAMAGEFPGAPSTDALWNVLVQGEIAPIQAMPARWELDKSAIFSAKAGEKDRTYLDSAFCLTDDASIPSRHDGRQVAIGKKVLQTLLTQLAAQGSVLDTKRTALVVATSWCDESYFATGTANSAGAPVGFTPGEQVAALASAFALGGPVLSVDTACSSFPYAIDMAKALLSSGQADNAIVMALNTVLPPALFLGFSQLTAFSARASMQAFGQDADGIVPGECAAAFLVEPVSQALAARRQPLGSCGRWACPPTAPKARCSHRANRLNIVPMSAPTATWTQAASTISRPTAPAPRWVMRPSWPRWTVSSPPIETPAKN